MEHARGDSQYEVYPRVGVQEVELRQLLPSSSSPRSIRSQRASITNASDKSISESTMRGELASGPSRPIVLTYAQVLNGPLSRCAGILL